MQAGGFCLFPHVRLVEPEILVEKADVAQDFLTLWKDADPDIPVLKEAKAVYARLQ